MSDKVRFPNIFINRIKCASDAIVQTAFDSITGSFAAPLEEILSVGDKLEIPVTVSRALIDNFQNRWEEKIDAPVPKAAEIVEILLSIALTLSNRVVVNDALGSDIMETLLGSPCRNCQEDCDEREPKERSLN